MSRISRALGVGFAGLSAVAIACGSSSSEPPPTAQEAGADSDSGPEAAVEASAGTGTLGAACTDDSQCGAGGTKCLLPSSNSFFGNSGPAGGYCSLDCTGYMSGKTDVDPCVAIGGHCYGAKDGSGAVCYETCERGRAGSKCHGRMDVACASGRTRDNNPAPWDNCQPACGAMSACGAGRACDAQKGRCLDLADVHTGAADGTACSTPDRGQCAGECIKHQAPDADGGVGLVYVCGKACVSGFNPDGCGPLEACTYGYPGSTKGDLGICQQLCDTVADCKDTVHEVECAPNTIPNYGHGSCRVVGTTAKVDGGT